MVDELAALREIKEKQRILSIAEKNNLVKEYALRYDFPKSIVTELNCGAHKIISGLDNIIYTSEDISAIPTFEISGQLYNGNLSKDPIVSQRHIIYSTSSIYPDTSFLNDIGPSIDRIYNQNAEVGGYYVGPLANLRICQQRINDYLRQGQ